MEEAKACTKQHGIGCLGSLLCISIALTVNPHYPGAAFLLVLLAFFG